jgi:hypothetical protein
MRDWLCILGVLAGKCATMSHATCLWRTIGSKGGRNKKAGMKRKGSIPMCCSQHDATLSIHKLGKCENDDNRKDLQHSSWAQVEFILNRIFSRWC